MWEVYLDGYPMGRYENEIDAQIWCAEYDGDKTPSYEYVEDDLT